METAMQKLKRISNNLHEQYHEDITLKWLIDNIDDFIKEEKDQIIDAYYGGVKLLSGDIETAAKHYYYQTYNQNK